jgi:hypothetical protein
MPLILEEDEVDLIKRGLRALMFQPAGSLKDRATKLVELLDSNPECYLWVLMTQKDRQTWSEALKLWIAQAKRGEG